LLEKTYPHLSEEIRHSLVNVTLKPDKFFECVGHMACTWHVSHLISASFILGLSLKSFLSHHFSSEWHHRWALCLGECILYPLEQRSFLFSLSSQLYHDF